MHESPGPATAGWLGVLPPDVIARQSRAATRPVQAPTVPAIARRNQVRSTSAMCRASPSSVSVDGGADRRLSSSSDSPAHFIANVAR